MSPTRPVRETKRNLRFFSIEVPRFYIGDGKGSVRATALVRGGSPGKDRGLGVPGVRRVPYHALDRRARRREGRGRGVARRARESLRSLLVSGLRVRTPPGVRGRGGARPDAGLLHALDRAPGTQERPPGARPVSVVPAGVGAPLSLQRARPR